MFIYISVGHRYKYVRIYLFSTFSLFFCLGSSSGSENLSDSNTVQQLISLLFFVAMLPKLIFASRPESVYGFPFYIYLSLCRLSQSFPFSIFLHFILCTMQLIEVNLNKCCWMNSQMHMHAYMSKCTMYIPKYVCANECLAF